MTPETLMNRAAYSITDCGEANSMEIASAFRGKGDRTIFDVGRTISRFLQSNPACITAKTTEITDLLRRNLSKETLPQFIADFEEYLVTTLTKEREDLLDRDIPFVLAEPFFAKTLLVPIVRRAFRTLSEEWGLKPELSREIMTNQFALVR